MITVSVTLFLWNRSKDNAMDRLSKCVFVGTGMLLWAVVMFGCCFGSSPAAVTQLGNQVFFGIGIFFGLGFNLWLYEGMEIADDMVKRATPEQLAQAVMPALQPRCHEHMSYL